MDVSIVYGVIDRKVQGNDNAGICRIVAFRTIGKLLITDEEQIVQVFGDRSVFVGKDLNTYKADDIIEMTFTRIIDELKEYPKIFFSQIRPSSAILTIEIKQPEIENRFLNLNTVQKQIPDNLIDVIKTKSRFCFSISDEIIGPFKFHNGLIIPEIGTSSKLYRLNTHNQSSFIEYPDFANRQYPDFFILLEIPKPVAQLDCSTETQLLDWLKEKLRNGQDDKKVAEVLNHFRKRFTYDSLDTDIEKSRFLRIEKVLKKLQLSTDELEKLKDNQDFSKVISEAVSANQGLFLKEILEEQQSFREKIELENRADEEKRKSLLEEINGLDNIYENKFEEISSLEAEIGRLKQETNFLQSNQESLIATIKIASQIVPSQPLHQASYKVNTTFCEKIIYDIDQELFFTDLNEFEDVLESLKVRGRSFLISNIELLRSHNFFIVHNVLNLLGLLKSTANITIYLNQAEGDWLKFEKWFNCGLSEMVSEALRNPTQNYCYVLQDFNIASPECYAKPIIDISRGIRKKVPGQDSTWPDNIWIFLVPLEVEIEDFGFEVQEETTFKDWKILKDENKVKSLDFEMTKKWKLR